jgi:phosphoribosyl-AMP cyclohydrolase / phosphoribosyl-ATP pyrophosphohydrolase
MNDDIKLDFSKGDDGLIPAIVQSAYTKEVLMLGFMNEEAFKKTRATGLVTFYSRSRKSLWTKGETSGHVLHVESLSVDCDADSILVMVTPDGPTCHTGEKSCFFRSFSPDKTVPFSLYDLQFVIQSRKESGAESSYTKQLFDKGINKIAQKVGEEATEVVIAALNESGENFLEESADLLFHFLVLLAKKGVSIHEVEKVLSIRHSVSLKK